MQYGIVTALCLVFCCGAASAEEGRKWYTPAKVATARQNIEQYEWAQQ